MICLTHVRTSLSLDIAYSTLIQKKDREEKDREEQKKTDLKKRENKKINYSEKKINV